MVAKLELVPAAPGKRLGAAVLDRLVPAVVLAVLFSIGFVSVTGSHSAGFVLAGVRWPFRGHYWESAQGCPQHRQGRLRTGNGRRPPNGRPPGRRPRPDPAARCPAGGPAGGGTQDPARRRPRLPAGTECARRLTPLGSVWRYSRASSHLSAPERAFISGTTPST